MAAAITNQEPVPHNNIHLRVTEAWQKNIAGKIAAPVGNKLTEQPQVSTLEQSAIDKFIENMHATSAKKDLFVLINKKLRSLSAIEREKFINGLVQTLKTSEFTKDQTLLKEKFNPAYSMYIATDILVNQLNQESLSKIGQAPREDDEDDSDEI